MGMFPPARAMVLVLLAGCGGDDPGVTRDPDPSSVADAGADTGVLVPRDAAPSLPIGQEDSGGSRPDAARPDAQVVAEDAGQSVPGCGGIAGLPCPEGEFCSHEGGSDVGCGFADSLGTCVKKSEVCTQQSQPVCGCDGISYDNACKAHAAGVSVQAKAPCKADRELNCDERDVLCKKARPDCPDQQVPAVIDGCWGECQPIGACVCHNADECPLRESYVCHMSAQHCGPYVN